MHHVSCQYLSSFLVSFSLYFTLIFFTGALLQQPLLHGRIILVRQILEPNDRACPSWAPEVLTTLYEAADQSGPQGAFQPMGAPKALLTSRGAARRVYRGSRRAILRAYHGLRRNRSRFIMAAEDEEDGARYN